MTASSETVEAPARPMMRWAAAIRAGRSGKNSAISTGKFIRAQAAATRALSSPRACWVRRIRCRSSGFRSASAAGTTSAMTRAPLRAAGHQKVQALPDVLGIGNRGGGDDRWAEPDCRSRGSWPGSTPFKPGKPQAISVDARAQETIGAAHHRVLLMQDGRNPEEPGGEKRRHGRIAAKADHGARLDAPELDGGGREARAQGERSARLGERAGLRRLSPRERREWRGRENPRRI